MTTFLPVIYVCVSDKSTVHARTFASNANSTAFALLPSFTICQISSKAKMLLKHNRRFSFVIDAMIGKCTLFWSPYRRGLMHDPGTRLGILCTMHRLIWIRHPAIYFLCLWLQDILCRISRGVSCRLLFWYGCPYRMVAHLFYRCRSYDLSKGFQLRSIYINGQTDQPEGYLTD